MAISHEIVRALASEWIGQSLSEEESRILLAMYESLSRSLAAFPERNLIWVEPALRSVPAAAPEEVDR